MPRKYGSEIDLRTSGSKIILNHDPYKAGDKLEDYLANYDHGTLILNIKESGLEYEAIRLAKKYKIKNFFLLDVEMPLICINKKKLINICLLDFQSMSQLRHLINSIIMLVGYGLIRLKLYPLTKRIVLF